MLNACKNVTVLHVLETVQNLYKRKCYDCWVRRLYNDLQTDRQTETDVQKDL